MSIYYAHMLFRIVLTVRLDGQKQQNGAFFFSSQTRDGCEESDIFKGVFIILRETHIPSVLLLTAAHES